MAGWASGQLQPFAFVPPESRRVKLQGILADLRDVDGLPPKVTGPPPGTPQPRPHEGKRPLPKARSPGAHGRGGAAELSPELLWPQGQSLASSLQPPCRKSSSVCLSPFSCLSCPVRLSLPVSFFPAVILDLVLSLSLFLTSCLSPFLPLSVFLSLSLPLSAPSLPYPYQVPLASPQTFSSWTLSGAGR